MIRGGGRGFVGIVLVRKAGSDDSIHGTIAGVRKRLRARSGIQHVQVHRISNDRHAALLTVAATHSDAIDRFSCSGVRGSYRSVEGSLAATLEREFPNDPEFFHAAWQWDMFRREQEHE